MIALSSQPNVLCQEFQWIDRTAEFDFQGSIQVFSSQVDGPTPELWYVKFTPADKQYRLEAFMANDSTGESITDFARRKNTLVAINAGFFSLVTYRSYSAIISNGELLGKNIESVMRVDGKYFVTRALFSLNRNAQPRFDWIFHFGSGIEDIRSYLRPLNNRPGSKANRPDKDSGRLHENMLCAVGGGPMLLRQSRIEISDTAEVFWNSGIAAGSARPRTAIGATATGDVILCAVAGTGGTFSGLNLKEFANLLYDIGCVDALNLDGGGSTQLVLGKQAERIVGTTRKLPSFLAIIEREH